MTDNLTNRQWETLRKAADYYGIIPMCDYRYGIENKIKELKSNYHLDSLQSTHKSVLDDLDRISKNITLYLAAITEQQEVVEATTFRPYVYLQRRTNYDNHIEYEVDLRFLPQIPEILNVINQPERGHLFLIALLRDEGYGGDGFSFPRYEEQKKFKGQERRAAIAYAEELAKKHGAEIIKAGWGWKENKAA